jgi:hypothetical protein
MRRHQEAHVDEAILYSQSFLPLQEIIRSLGPQPPG